MTEFGDSIDANRTRGEPGVGKIFLWVSAVIFILGLVAHVLYTKQPFFMDEYPVISNQLRFAYERTIVPDHAKYPTFFYYLSLPATALSIIYNYLSGSYNSITQAASELFLFERTDLAMGARLFNVALFYASAVLTALIIRRQTSSVAALTVFLLVGSAPGFLPYSAYALPDITLIFLSAGIHWFLYQLKTPGDYRNLYVAVAIVGLAISTKYNAAGLLLPVAIWTAIVFWRSGTLISWQFMRHAAFSSLILVAFFLLGSPGWVIDTEFFVSELRYEIEHAQDGHLGASGMPILGQIELLLRSLPVLFLLSIPGVLFAISRARADSAIPISAAVGTLILAAMSEKQSFHYLFPAVPSLVILAGFSTDVILKRFEVGGTVVLVFIAFLSSILSLYFSSQYLKPNTTDLAKTWFVENVPEGSSVVSEWAYVPVLHSQESVDRLRNSKPYHVLGSDPLDQEPLYHVISLEPDFLALEASDAEYLVTSSRAFNRFFEFGFFTRLEPAIGSAIRGKFESTRDFYSELFASRDWKLVFEEDTGNGPRTLIYHRDRSD